MKYLNLLILLFISTICFGQSSINLSAGPVYLKSSSLFGVSFSNDILFKNNSLIVGFEFNFAEGNRNFDPTEHFGIFKSKPGLTINEEEWIGLSEGFSFYHDSIRLKDKTSNTYQLSAKIGYSSNVPKIANLSYEIGLYFTYVNKTYLAIYVEDIDLELIQMGYEVNASFFIPYHIRYIDIGPFVKLKYDLYESTKYKLGIFSQYNFALKNAGWCSFSIYSNINF